MTGPAFYKDIVPNILMTGGIRERFKVPFMIIFNKLYIKKKYFTYLRKYFSCYAKIFSCL